MTRSNCLTLLSGVVLCAASGFAAGQEVPAEDPKTIAKEWLGERTKEFESYRFALEGPKPVALTMETRSLLNWSNAERGTAVGAVFLWTNDGRPELIACAFGRGQWLRHEFHSLSTQPIMAELDGTRVHRFKPGIEWRELADSPEPAASRALRLAQMRRQAERFRATFFVLRPMGNKEPAETRLLTTAPSSCSCRGPTPSARSRWRRLPRRSGDMP